MLKVLDELDGHFGDEDLLTFVSSLQLTDSFFPSGLYTLSHGLESLTQEDQIGAADLYELIADYLRHGVGPSDATALGCAHRAVEQWDLDLACRADTRLTAVKLPREARETSIRLGRQLLTMSRWLFGGNMLEEYGDRGRDHEVPGNHAVVLGLVTATLQIPRERAVIGELYAISAGMVAAAVRLAVIDHRMAQAVLHRLKPVIVESAQAALDRDVREIASCVPRIDIMAMRHERAAVRLFVS